MRTRTRTHASSQTILGLILGTVLEEAHQGLQVSQEESRPEPRLPITESVQ